MSANYKKVPAPAKLNLFLHVTGRRPDGYHTLQTLFTFVNYGDTLDFTRTESGNIQQQHPLPGIAAQDDLCIRAARLLQHAGGVSYGAIIGIEKRIPVGGGLGGGSSDAATTLLTLNRLWGLDWERARLAALGIQLGADVPVFIGGHSAFAEGIGEQLTPVEVPECWYLIAHPGIAVATREIFEDPDLTRDSITVRMCDFSMGFGRNDLQPVVMRRYSQVAQLLAWLGRFGEARMTGSGACCFVPFEDASRAQSALLQMPPEYKGFIARGMNQHPLRDWV
ncbi:MAG: 4-(cytidine 5'-diphospho)-2-C-methyl-D-erythritol kinase [Betaproteobacteria bacterium]|nr:4-(cytidine 5'-diphospho)-2-C-methyl-D-erythritol kinase [Betaproteobacteria bacterium]